MTTAAFPHAYPFRFVDTVTQRPDASFQGGRVRTRRGLGADPGIVVSFGQAGNGDLFVQGPGAIYRIDPG